MSYIYDLTDTWNAGGTVFTAIKMNVTNSASASGSKVISLQVNGTEQFSVDKDGKGYVAGNLGLGVTPSAWIGSYRALNIGDSGLISSRTGASINNVEIGVNWFRNSGGSFVYKANGYGTNYQQFDGAHYWYLAPSGTAGNAISFTQAMTLDASANLNVDSGTGGGRLTFSPGSSTNTIFSTTTGFGAYNILTLNGSQNVFQTSGSERMRIDSSGNLLVGTTSNPSSLKFLASDGTVSTGFLPYTSGSVAYTGTWTNHAFGFATNSTERMRIDANGNVGIGTSSPAEALEVTSATAFARSVQLHTDISGGCFVTANTAGTSASGSPPFNQSLYLQTNNASSGVSSIIFRYGTNGSYVEQARIDSSGNLLVGTTSGSGRLTVVGPSQMVQTYTGSSNPFVWGQFDATGAASLNNQANAAMLFATNNTERARIDSSGSLLVGTTSAGGEAGLSIKPNESAGAAAVIWNRAATSNTTYAAIFRNGNVDSGTISYTNTATSYNTSSDARLKENIAPADDAAALIDAIQVRKFDWKADGSHQRYGMVAQELLEVAPEAVSVPADEEAMMGVDYSKLVPMLIKEVQSLRARVAQLEGK